MMNWEDVIFHAQSNKLRHMGKERLLRQGQLPVSIQESDELHARIQQLQQPQEELQQEAHEAQKEL
jgi:hypothetical protein